MAEAPVSLYFDLEPGQVADLDVVAKAALAWSAAIKELAYVLDPSLEIRVEVANATASSFSLNAIIRSLHKRIEEAKSDPLTLRAILIALVIHFGWETADYLYQHVLDGADGNEHAVMLSEDQMNELADKVARAQSARVAQAHAQQVYREAERDPAIRGVGISTEPGRRPPVVVPRAEFQARAGHGQIREETVRKRVVPDRQIVVLIKPVLEQGSRRWSLRAADGEHGYTMKDTDFVERVLTGTTAVPMVAGIEMDVDIETTEEFEDGVWVPTERSVMKVHGLKRPPIQISMIPPPDSAEPEDDRD